MTVSTTESGHHGRSGSGPEWEYLLRTWRGLDVPQGWRAEIDDGRIALLPPPRGGHHIIVESLQRRLCQCLPEDLGIYQRLSTAFPALGKLFVPHLMVVPCDIVLGPGHERDDPVDAAEALLVVEITSKSNARHDRTKKLWAYAHAPVPLYLLVDRYDERGPMVTLFSDPQNGTYKHADATPFGRPLTLPEPFHATLPTEKFPH
ncbi:Uma2 family endonuclease [Streptomyces sp. NA04227]|uniref:Uma2 family endonuclease n=1 Tax=Streptomyces sp. NA04227 TaxID=2742136 RepID=UPI0015905753|nr:Uma2 family endonuclease [Streptomyces sp. NA04227]QKW08296.1 Uma2 family endonuclease [Streptomyces sp. NA04227]